MIHQMRRSFLVQVLILLHVISCFLGASAIYCIEFIRRSLTAFRNSNSFFINYAMLIGLTAIVVNGGGTQVRFIGMICITLCCTVVNHKANLLFRSPGACQALQSNGALQNLKDPKVSRWFLQEYNGKCLGRLKSVLFCSISHSLWNRQNRRKTLYA